MTCIANANVKNMHQWQNHFHSIFRQHNSCTVQVNQILVNTKLGHNRFQPIGVYTNKCSITNILPQLNVIWINGIKIMSIWFDKDFAKHTQAVSMIISCNASGANRGARDKASAIRWLFPGTQVTVKLYSSYFSRILWSLGFPDKSYPSI